MNNQGKVVPRGGSIWTRRVIPVACATLAILAAVLLVAPGLYFLGVAALLYGFLNLSSGIRFGPPTASDLANDARNAAELAGMYREAIVMIGLGAVIIVTSLLVIRVGARRSRSKAPGSAITSSGGWSAE
jgi:hypothetical protein